MVETGCKLGVIGNYKGEGVSEASICIEKYEPKLTISRSIVGGGGGTKRPPLGRIWIFLGTVQFPILLSPELAFLSHPWT